MSCIYDYIVLGGEAPVLIDSFWIGVAEPVKISSVFENFRLENNVG